MAPNVAIRRLYARLEALEKADADNKARIAALEAQAGIAPPEGDADAADADAPPPLPHARDLAKALRVTQARVKMK